MLKVRLQPAAFLVLVFASLMAYAQTPTSNAAPPELDAKALIKEVAENYKTMQRYQFTILKTNISQTEANGLTSKQHSENRYELAMDEGNRFRIESASSYDNSLVISDGTTRWAYVLSLKQFTKRDANTPPTKPEPKSPVLDPTYFAMDQRSLISRLQQTGARMPKVIVIGQENLTANGQTVACVVLHLTNGSNNDQKVWIDKSRKLVLRDWNHARSRSGNGISMGDFVTQYDYTPLKINEPLPAELFTFSPPAGVAEVAEFKPPERMPSVRVNLTGKDALAFTLKDLTGKPFELASAKDKIVLLDFWASWCGPCIAEMPHIQKLHEEFKDKGLLVIGVNNEELEIASEFMKDKHYTFVSVVDEGRAVAQQYQVSGIPQVLLIGHDGKVKWHSIGFGNGKETELRAAVEKALNNETPAPSSSFPSMAVRP